MPKTPERAPTDKPQILRTPALRTLPPRPGPGRKKRVEEPPMPQEVLDAMSELEQSHYQYFLQCIHSEYPDLSPFESIQVQLLALSYISVLRMETKQLASGELITMARQDPRTQFMRYLDALSVRRKDKKPVIAEDQSELSEALRDLWTKRVSS